MKIEFITLQILLKWYMLKDAFIYFYEQFIAILGNYKM